METKKASANANANVSVNVKLDGLQCLRCGYKWIPYNKTKRPKTCAGCRSPYWDEPRGKED